MGKGSRDKGRRAELEAAEALGAEKVSRAGYEGHDLEWEGRLVEVKRRASGFKSLYKWLEDVQMLMLRADRLPWLVVMTPEELLDLQDEARLDGIASVVEGWEAE